MSRVTGGAAIVAVLIMAALRGLGSAGWHDALGIAVALLGVHGVVLAVGALRRELRATRLLLPAVALVQGALWWRGAVVPWQVGALAAAALEVAFVVVTIRALRRARGDAGPPEARIARAFDGVVPARVARFAAVELVILAAALGFVTGGWRRVDPPGFTYHRESGLRLLLPVLPLLLLGDVLLLELVVLRRAPTWLAIVIHVVAAYGFVWLVGIYATTRARPHRLVDGRLVLHRGILGSLELPVTQIESIAELPSFADDWKKRRYLQGAMRLDLGGTPVLELHLRSPARALGVVGEGAPRTRVLISVDEPAPLLDAVRAAMARG